MNEEPFFKRVKIHPLIPADNDIKLRKMSAIKPSMEDFIDGTIKLNGKR